MRSRAALAALLLLAGACATARRAEAPLPPLGSEGEVHVYALPLPREAERLAFTLDSVALVARDGAAVPLQVSARALDGAALRGQRLLASGRVPPGEYVGLTVRAGSASLAAGDDRSRLLVEPEPARVALELRVSAGTAVVVWAALKPAESLRGEVGFAPAFTATLAPQTPPQVALYATNTGAASVTAADRRTRLVTGVVPVGAEPRGIALDRAARSAWVALSREDALEILDVAANRAIGRIRLAPGDGPTELERAADGTIVVLNARSRTVAFVDPLAQAELGRVPTGDGPVALRVDRSGRRAYVANRGSGTVTVLDVPNREVAGTIATDPEPLDLELSRDGSRLYVIHRGSAHLAVYALPSLALEARAFGAFGATAIKVDPRTDLVYLARGGERGVQVFEPVSLQPLEQLDLPGAVSRMAIDDAENALLAVMPERRSIAVVDLTSRKVLAEIPVGAAPDDVALAGER